MWLRKYFTVNILYFLFWRFKQIMWLRFATQQEGMIQLFAAAKCHVTPSWVKRFMKQINRFKSLLQCRGSVLVYKMAEGADGKSQMYVLFSYLHNMSINSLHLCFRLLGRLLHCCKLLSKYAARLCSTNLHLTQPWPYLEQYIISKR